MQELFNAAWSILNIKITYEGLTFAIWHPMAFVFIIGTILKIFLLKSKEG